MNRLNHQIIGSGVVGKATGIWLKANNERVIFYDKDDITLEKLKHEGHLTSNGILPASDVYWVCTPEWNVDEVMEQIKQTVKEKKVIVIRSTTPIGIIHKLCNKYTQYHIAHNPEFLKANTAIDDIFNPDRVIIGSYSKVAIDAMRHLYSSSNIPVIVTDPTTSEMIKYASNCWLATQISYWNEVKKLCNSFNVNPQEMVNAVCLDKRISKYGTAMRGKPYGGFCFPKDIKSFIEVFRNKNIEPYLLEGVEKVNESIS